jgi:hypothetical protein
MAHVITLVNVSLGRGRNASSVLQSLGNGIVIFDYLVYLLLEESILVDEESLMVFKSFGLGQ